MENIRGMVLMTVSMLMFAIADAGIKLTSATLPTSEILIFLGLGGAIVFGIIAMLRGEKLFVRAVLHRALLLRMTGEMIGTVGMITALAMIPYSTTAAITQVIPLTITMGAALFLGEAVGWQRWTAIGVGFVGVLLIIRPGLDGFDPNSAFALLAVIGLTVRDLATRKVPHHITTPVVAAYGFFILVPTGFGLLLHSGGVQVPGPTEYTLLAGTLVLITIGYGAITAAMRVGEISATTPLRYSRIVFAMIIGMVLFGEKIDAIALIGTTIVIISGLFTIYREHRVRLHA
jgi:drug/metabolite transporter (DMT)-like permease